ncbi:type IX secretion system protein PorG [Lutibacter sp.]
MKKFVLFITFVCVTISSNAQMHEIGVLVGGSNYIGDIGPEYYINPRNFTGSIFYKRNINPRIALRGTFTYAKIAANDADATNRERYIRGIKFDNNIKEFALGLEFNYFDYNLDDYRYTHTPYLLLEVAAFNYNVATRETSPNQYEYKSKTSFAIPIGIGYKTKLFQDVAIALEIRARYTFVDDLDYNNNTINSLTFGNPNSNDWYVLSGFSISYSFGRPPCYATPF